MITLSEATIPTIPVRVLVVAMSALLLPMVVTWTSPPATSGYPWMVWMPALVPAFLLSFYRGWRGAGMALLAGVVAVMLSAGLPAAFGARSFDPALLMEVTIFLVAVCAGIAWLAERLIGTRREAEEQALTDPLTELPNRRQALEFLDRKLVAAQGGRPLAVVLYDLDGFKAYNDEYGRVAGDAALRALGRVLRNITGGKDISARFGGEEFISVVSPQRASTTLVFVQRVVHGLRTAPVATGLRMSAGVAYWDAGMSSAEDLVAAADAALYSAKQAGGNCVRVWGINGNSRAAA